MTSLLGTCAGAAAVDRSKEPAESSNAMRCTSAALTRWRHAKEARRASPERRRVSVLTGHEMANARPRKTSKPRTRRSIPCWKHGACESSSPGVLPRIAAAVAGRRTVSTRPGPAEASRVNCIYGSVSGNFHLRSPFWVVAHVLSPSSGCQLGPGERVNGR